MSAAPEIVCSVSTAGQPSLSITQVIWVLIRLDDGKNSTLTRAPIDTLNCEESPALDAADTNQLSQLIALMA
jgi:hypothetical protein